MQGQISLPPLTDSKVKLQVGVLPGKTRARNDGGGQEERVADISLHDHCAVTVHAAPEEALWILREEDPVTLGPSVWLDAAVVERK